MNFLIICYFRVFSKFLLSYSHHPVTTGWSQSPFSNRSFWYVSAARKRKCNASSRLSRKWTSYGSRSYLVQFLPVHFSWNNSLSKERKTRTRILVIAIPIHLLFFYSFILKHKPFLCMGHKSGQSMLSKEVNNNTSAFRSTHPHSVNQ